MRNSIVHLRTASHAPLRPRDLGSLSQLDAPVFTERGKNSGQSLGYHSVAIDPLKH
jgi:hypothetical protein